MSHDAPLRGRGAGSNPASRFVSERYERMELDVDPDPTDPEAPLPRTQFLRDDSRSLITFNDSPDVGFEASINAYRGCEHGCIYCYARPTHEYFGLSAGLDFESRILVKERAPEMLRRELSAPRWKPQVLAMSGVTDPYQPIERRLQLSRRCLEVLLEFRNPVVIITKNRLVARDADLLGELASHKAAAVFVSVTSLRPEIHRVLEPRTSAPERRLETISTLAAAGIPVGVLVAPVIPALTDHELPAIIEAAAKAGAAQAGYVMLRLPHGLVELFEDWLTQCFPDRKEKVLSRIRETRGGKLNDPRFGSRMRGEGIFADQTAALFDLAVRKAGLARTKFELSTAHFRNSAGRQLTLFDDF
jgi:DNA repair photolyase